MGQNPTGIQSLKNLSFQIIPSVFYLQQVFCKLPAGGSTTGTLAEADVQGYTSFATTWSSLIASGKTIYM
jgi:hypothetical protein